MTVERMVAAFLLLLALPQWRPPALDIRLVYVAPLPSDTRNAAAAAFAREVRLALERRGIQILAGPEVAEAASAEAITSASTAGGAQVSVGIRVVSGRASCATVRAPVPSAVPSPVPDAKPTAEQELYAWVKQTTLAERSRDSDLLAKELQHLGQPCSAREHWASSYFLKGASGASVVIELSESSPETTPVGRDVWRSMSPSMREHVSGDEVPCLWRYRYRGPETTGVGPAVTANRRVALVVALWAVFGWATIDGPVKWKIRNMMAEWMGLVPYWSLWVWRVVACLVGPSIRASRPAAMVSGGACNSVN